MATSTLLPPYAHSVHSGLAEGPSHRYYENTEDYIYGRTRWVEYGSDKPDPSQIPAEWHGWMHHTTDEPVALRADYKPPKYVTSWVPHLTGTDLAYHPHNYPLNPGYQPRDRIPVRDHAFPATHLTHPPDSPCSSRSGNLSRHSHLRHLRPPRRTTSSLAPPRFAQASTRVRCVAVR